VCVFWYSKFRMRCMRNDGLSASFVLKLWGNALLSAMMFAVILEAAFAQPLDDVRLEYQDEGVVATISLSEPVRYLRHFPSSHGKTLEIFYERVQDVTNKDVWKDNEVRKSPPSRLIPKFTVTTRDQQSNPKLVIEFSDEAEYSVAPGKDSRSLLVTIIPEKRPVSTGPLPFLPVIKQEPVAVAAEILTAEELAVAENNSKARVLMVQGRDALSAKKDEEAVDAFNKLLLLPPNDYTQDGQEWIGVARERAGQTGKAKIEYDLYLRLFPDGDGAERVAQRLSRMSGKDTAPKSAVGEGEEKKQARWMTLGSVSARYYFGNSTTDSNYTFNNTRTTTTYSQTDQSMLITNLDVSRRYLSDEYDGRLVFRDTNSKSFLADQHTQNRVYAAYGELKSRSHDYLLRLGRQSATGGGVLGRFDGAFASYDITPKNNVRAAVGSLTDFSQGSNPTFVSGSVDIGLFSVYAIKQKVDGAIDRRAVGTEFRYFEGDKTVFALLDYDTYFRALNAAQVMGTFNALGGTMNFMLDSRKSPSLSMRNALNGAGTSSIDALLQTMMKSSLRNLALQRTAISNSGQIGMTVPVNGKWQVGGDVRITNTSGLPASGTTPLQGMLDATPSRGTETGVTTQLIGSSLYKQGDIWSINVSYNTSSAVTGYAMSLYNHMPYKGGLNLDSSLQFYSQKDQFDATTTRVSPMLVASYRISEQLYFDMDGGVEWNDYSGTQQTNKTTRYFTSAGLRLDF